MVDPLQTGASGYDARLIFPADDMRTEPPLLTYGYLIDTVRQIPGYMQEQKRWWEMAIVIAYNILVVGRASLERGHA